MLLSYASRRHRPARLLLLAAGLAVAGPLGCSGPGMFAKSPGTSVFARFQAHGDEQSGRARVCSAEQTPAESQTAESQTATADAAMQVVDPFAEARPSVAMPAPGGPVGVARVNDHRLPPAAPLGATNPFGRSGAAPTASRADSSRTAMPTFRYASRSRTSDVPNADMIVDSAAVPGRAIWRNDSIDSQRLAADDTTRTVDYTMVARRPFVSSNALHETPGIATANVPVEILPGDGHEAAFVASPQTVVEESNDAEPAEAPAPPVDEPLLPTADPAFAAGSGTLVSPGLAAAEPVFSDEAPVPSVELSPGGPTLAMASPSGPEVAPPPPALTETVPTPLAIYSGQSRVTPIEVSEGDREAARRIAARSTSGLNKPIAIGLVLAFVMTGVVVIRRRFC